MVIIPRSVYGSSLTVVSLPDGRVYVDIPANPRHQYIPRTRGGPDYPHHHCRFDDYGLVDQENKPLVRCRMCALVKRVRGLACR